MFSRRLKFNTIAVDSEFMGANSTLFCNQRSENTFSFLAEFVDNKIFPLIRRKFFVNQNSVTIIISPGSSRSPVS